MAAHPGSPWPAPAKRLGLGLRLLVVWCKTAVACEILGADHAGRDALAPHRDKVLATPGHPRQVGGYVQLGGDSASAAFLALCAAFHSGQYVPFQEREERCSSPTADAT